ncbi:DUF2760 domain-containing protein [Thiotrichales bacterium 19S3-7]|nr:DUF2760 domain-containing protein [Thiotrichales bacterium 19S3-7]MCF6800551.1 DUF2760 domain-containing protein [Thiotrichales bacterium 19S3-11]
MKIKLSWGMRIKALFLGEVRIKDNSTDRSTDKPAIDKSLIAEHEKIEQDQAKAQSLTEANYEQTAALQLLHLLQKHGRLVDFLHEDIVNYTDEEVGAGARIVHQGCKKVLSEYVQLTAIRDEKEESTITVDKGFDTQAIHIIGNIQGEPPYQGILVHKGWQVSQLKLPKVTDKAKLSIVNPAEVEL